MRFACLSSHQLDSTKQREGSFPAGRSRFLDSRELVQGDTVSGCQATGTDTALE